MGLCRQRCIPSPIATDPWAPDIFTIHVYGGHLDYMAKVVNKLSFPALWRFNMKFGFDWPSGPCFREEDFLSFYLTVYESL